MSEFLREVDEDYRRDQLMQLWKRFGPWVIGAAVASVVGVTGAQLWNAKVADERQAQAEVYEQALNALNAERIEQGRAYLQELQAGNNTGYATLSRLAEARSALMRGEKAQAIAAYDALSADADAPKEFRSLATLLSTLAQLEGLSADQVQERLTLLAQPGEPWAALANEAMGMAYMRESRMERAREIFDLLAVDPTVPPGVQARAQNILALLGPAPEGEAQ